MPYELNFAPVKLMNIRAERVIHHLPECDGFLIVILIEICGSLSGGSALLRLWPFDAFFYLFTEEFLVSAILRHGVCSTIWHDFKQSHLFWGPGSAKVRRT